MVRHSPGQWWAIEMVVALVDRGHAFLVACRLIDIKVRPATGTQLPSSPLRSFSFVNCRRIECLGVHKCGHAFDDGRNVRLSMAPFVQAVSYIYLFTPLELERAAT